MSLLRLTRPALFGLLASLTLNGCADSAPKPPAKVVIDCIKGGTGLSAPPSAETLAAVAAQKAAAEFSLDELYQRVGKGDVTAQIELGLRYAVGKDLPQDATRALPLFGNAWRNGNPVAGFYIGTAYSNGFGVEKDDVKAIMIWEETAKMGHADSQYWLGFMIANGRGGIQPDWCAAAPLFKAAADQKVSDAALMLGLGYHEGEFGVVDHEKAADWYREANRMSFNKLAQFNLRRLIEAYQVEWREGDPGKAMPPQPKKMQLQIDDQAVKNTG